VTVLEVMLLLISRFPASASKVPDPEIGPVRVPKPTRLVFDASAMPPLRAYRATCDGDPVSGSYYAYRVRRAKAAAGDVKGKCSDG
jgi:hypothetical protein